MMFFIPLIRYLKNKIKTFLAHVGLLNFEVGKPEKKGGGGLGGNERVRVHSSLTTWILCPNFGSKNYTDWLDLKANQFQHLTI